MPFFYDEASADEDLDAYRRGIDPWGGDQAAEDAEYEANARYDYIREAYAGEVESAASLAEEARFWAAEEAIAEQDAIEAHGGPATRPVYSDNLPF